MAAILPHNVLSNNDIDPDYGKRVKLMNMEYGEILSSFENGEWTPKESRKMFRQAQKIKMTHRMTGGLQKATTRLFSTKCTTDRPIKIDTNYLPDTHEDKSVDIKENESVENKEKSVDTKENDSVENKEKSVDTKENDSEKNKEKSVDTKENDSEKNKEKSDIQDHQSEENKDEPEPNSIGEKETGADQPESIGENEVGPGK
ncbi:nipped-B-like protein [Pieris napi]|uniref:nipped-B-like protein n=1 Tax=Pieris napi TaxID=78633 RepID=UPI001FBBED75|nr:nipped-B-like protein [Pieris napi]